MEYCWVTAILLIFVSETYCAPQSYHKVSHQKHEEKTEEVYSSDPSHHRASSSLPQSTHVSNLGSLDLLSTGNSMYGQQQKIYDSNFNSQYDNFNKKIQPPDNMAYSSYYVSHSPSSSSFVIKGDQPFVNNYQTTNHQGVKSFQENEMSYGHKNFAGTILNERSDVIESGNYDNGQKLLKLTAVPGLVPSSSQVRGDTVSLHTGETFGNSGLSSGTNLKSYQSTQHLSMSPYLEQEKSRLNSHKTIITETSDSSHLSQPKITSSYFVQPQIDHSSILESNLNSGRKTSEYVVSTKEDSSHFSQPTITSSYFVKPQIDHSSIFESNSKSGSKISEYSTNEGSSHFSQPKITSSYFLKPQIDHSSILESNLNSGNKNSGYVVSTKEETYSNSNGDGWTKKVHEYQPLTGGQESGPAKKYSSFKTTGSQTDFENNKNTGIYTAPEFIQKESKQLHIEETQPNYNIRHQISPSQLELNYGHRIEPSESSWSSWSSWSAWSSGPQEYSVESRKRIDSASMRKQEPLSDLSKTETKNVYKSSTYQQNEKQVQNLGGSVRDDNHSPIILGSVNQPGSTKGSSAYSWMVSSSNTPQQIHPAIANKQIESASLTRDDAFIESQKEIFPGTNQNSKVVSYPQMNYNHDTNVQIPGVTQTVLQPNINSVKKSKTEHQEYVQLSYDSQKPKGETFLTADFPSRDINEEGSLQHHERIAVPFPDQLQTNIQNSNTKVVYEKQVKPATNIVSIKSQPIIDLGFNNGQNFNAQRSQTLTINRNNNVKEREEITPGLVGNAFIDQERGIISDILETKKETHELNENEPIDAQTVHTGKKFSSSFKKEVHNSTEITESHSDDYNIESKKLRTATHQIVDGVENPQTQNYKFHEQEYMQSQFGPQKNLERIEQTNKNPIYDAGSNSRSYNQQFTKANSFNKYQSNYGRPDESLLENIQKNEGKIELHGKASESFNVQNQETEMKQNLEQMKSHMMTEMRKKHGFQTPVTFEASQSYGPQISAGKSKMQSEHYIEKHTSQAHSKPQTGMYFQTQSASLNQESEPCPYSQDGQELEKSFDMHQTHDNAMKSFERQRLLGSDDLFRRMRQKRYVPSFSYFQEENNRKINEYRRFEDQAEDFLGSEINAQIEENQRPENLFNHQQESQQLYQNPDFQFNSNNENDPKDFGQQTQESIGGQWNQDIEFGTLSNNKEKYEKHFSAANQENENLQQESQQVHQYPDFQSSSNNDKDFTDFGQQTENQEHENFKTENGNQREEPSQKFQQVEQSNNASPPKVEYTEAEYKELLQQLHEFVSAMNTKNKTLNDLLNEFESINSGNQNPEEKNKGRTEVNNNSSLNQEYETPFQPTVIINQETQNKNTQEQQLEDNYGTKPQIIVNKYEELDGQSSKIEQGQKTEDVFDQQSNTELGLEQVKDSQKLISPEKSYVDLSQQNNDDIQFGQEAQEYDRKPQNQVEEDFGQQTETEIEFGQQTQHNVTPQKLTDLGQQTENEFSQQSNSNVPFFQDTQQIQLPQNVFDLSKQQQTEDEFGQQTQEHEKPQKLIEFGQQTQDDFSQLNSDNLFGQETWRYETPQNKLEKQHPPTRDFDEQTDVQSNQNQILEHVQDLSQQNSDGFQFIQETLETQTAKIFELGYDRKPHEQREEFSQQNEFPQKLTELGQQTQDNFQHINRVDIHPQQGTEIIDQINQQTGSGIEFGELAQTSVTKQNPTEFEQQSNNDGISFGQEQESQSSQIVFGKPQKTEYDFNEQNNAGIEFGQNTQELETPQKLFDITQQNTEDFSPQVDSQNEFQQSFDLGQKTQEKLIVIGNTDSVHDIQFGQETELNQSPQKIFHQTQQQQTDNDFDQQENLEFNQKTENSPSVITVQAEDQVSQQENVDGIQFQQNEDNINQIEFGQSTDGSHILLIPSSFQRKQEVENEAAAGHVNNDKDQYSNVFDDVNENDNVEQPLNKTEPGKQEKENSTDKPKNAISSIHDIPKYTEEEYKKIIQKFNTIFDFKNALNNIKLKLGQTSNKENDNFDTAQKSKTIEEKIESQPTNIKDKDDSKENSNESKSNEDKNVNNNENKNKSEESNEIEDNKPQQSSSLWSSFRNTVSDTYSSAKEKVKEVAGRVKESLN